MKIVVLTALIAVLVLSGCPYNYGSNQMQDSEDNSSSMASGTDSDLSVREINVTAKQFSFEPDPIRVKLGERIKLNLTSLDVDHGFALPEFGVNKTIPAGKTVSVEFVADKKGSFQFYCSVFCGQGHSTMKGVLIVE